MFYYLEISEETVNDPGSNTDHDTFPVLLVFVVDNNEDLEWGTVRVVAQRRSSPIEKNEQVRYFNVVGGSE